MDYGHLGAAAPSAAARSAAGAAQPRHAAHGARGVWGVGCAPSAASVQTVPVMAAAYATRAEQVAALGRAIGQAEARQDTAALRALCREGLGLVARLELAALLLLEARRPPQA